MISTTSSPLGYSLGWRGWNSDKPPSSQTATTKSANSEVAATSSNAELAAKYETLSAKVETLTAGSVAGLSAGMINPLMSSTGSPFGMANPLLALNQGLPITGMASAGTPFPSQQGGAVDLTAGSVDSPSSLLA
jgi:hypothetical protein